MTTFISTQVTGVPGYGRRFTGVAAYAWLLISLRWPARACSWRWAASRQVGPPAGHPLP